MSILTNKMFYDIIQINHKTILRITWKTFPSYPYIVYNKIYQVVAHPNSQKVRKIEINCDFSRHFVVNILKRMGKRRGYRQTEVRGGTL